MEGDAVSFEPYRRTAISIHSLRMEGDRILPDAMTCCRRISIHSLRMEGDVLADYVGFVGNISIHSLRMEGDVRTIQQRSSALPFQSTPSAWRETR